jgi:hypothetical protein
MMKVASHPRMHLDERIVLAALLLCMVLAQSLSLAHRTLHRDVRMLAHTVEHAEKGPYLHEGARERQYAAAHGRGEGEGRDSSVLQRLVASHDEGNEVCRLMHGASGFLALKSHTAVIEIALQAHFLIAFNAAATAAWQAPLFEARGPPPLSL